MEVTVIILTAQHSTAQHLSLIHISAVLEIGWENGYGKLPDGTYRLVKTVNYDDVENYESFDVAAEFTIG